MSFNANNLPLLLSGIIEELFSEEDVERSIAFQSTLRDANELQNEVGFKEFIENSFYCLIHH